MAERLVGSYLVSERRASRVLLLARATYRYRSCLDPRTELRLRIREIAQARVRYGYRKIRVLLMDVDGTMTPGEVCLQSFPDGSVAEMKVFSAHDGAGIKLASIMGIRTGLITGRDSTATARRVRHGDGRCSLSTAARQMICGCVTVARCCTAHL